ncbi:MAG: hypothetical protein WC872_04905 [Candidatus Absconditabacterales bacterium]
MKKIINNIKKIGNIKIFLTFLFLVLTFGLKFSLNASDSPDAFIIEVEPSSFEANQPVDITLKAVKSDGSIVKDYQGDVIIEVNGINPDGYIVPNDGLYSFLPQDQGVKVFSKGLQIKSEGTFSVQAFDIVNESVKGEKNVIVGNVHSSTSDKIINLISPVEGGIEKNSFINVIGSIAELPNSPLQVFLNDQIINSSNTDSNGEFNLYITGTRQGDNSLQVKIVDVNNVILGESDIIKFAYSPIADGVFNSVQILPSGKIKQGTKANFIVSTSDSVSSVELKLSNGKTSPMDRKNAGSFSKELMMDLDGTIEVSLSLMSAGIKKDYLNITNLIVSKSASIGKVRLYSDSVDKTILNVTREAIGTAVKYKLSYGTTQNSLDQFVLVDTNQVSVQNLNTGLIYYFQITPLDENGDIAGTPSDITQAKIGEDITCIVKGIEIYDQKIGDKHFLVWTAVQNVEKYIIYRSEYETDKTDDMKKVGESIENKFEYPFNKLSKKNEYAYYVVEAICKDGSSLKIDNVKKVQVGPMENLLLFVIVSLFVYSIYKLYIYSKE